MLTIDRQIPARIPNNRLRRVRRQTVLAIDLLLAAVLRGAACPGINVPLAAVLPVGVALRALVLIAEVFLQVRSVHDLTDFQLAGRRGHGERVVVCPCAAGLGAPALRVCDARAGGGVVRVAIKGLLDAELDGAGACGSRAGGNRAGRRAGRRTGGRAEVGGVS